MLKLYDFLSTIFLLKYIEIQICMLKRMIFMKNNTKEKRERREKQNSRYEIGKIIQKGKLHSEKKLIKREKR